MDSGPPAPGAEFWVYWIPAAALAAGTATLGVITLSSKNRFDDLHGAPAQSPDALETQSSHTKTLALTTDIVGGATLVAAGVGLWLTARSDRPSSGATGLASAPRVGLGPATVTVGADLW